MGADPTQVDQERLGAAIETVANEIRDAAVRAGVAEHVAMVRIREGDVVDFKIVRREDAAVAYADQPIVQCLLSRPAGAGVVPVIAGDHTKHPTPIVTARLTINLQRGGDA